MIKSPKISSLFIYFLTFFTIANSALIIVGINELLLRLLNITFLLINLFLLIQNDKIQIKKYQFWAFIFASLIVIIDKLNDFINFPNLLDIGALINGVLLIFFCYTSGNKYNHIFWKSVFHSSVFSYLLLIIFNTATTVSLRNFNQDINVYGLLSFVFIYYNLKNKILGLFFIAIFTFFTVVIFESRFLLVCVSVLITSNYILKKYSFQKLKLYFKLYWAFIPGLLIGFAIWWEYFNNFGKGVTNLFTGRGFIWFNSIYMPILKNSFFLGLPSSDNFLTHLRPSFIFSNSSYVKEYIGFVITGGNTHSGIVYIIYNSGILGLVLFYGFLWNSLKNKPVVNNNYSLIFTLSIIFLLFGRSFYGVYLMGNLMLFALTIPLSNPLHNYWRYKNVKEES